MRGQNNRGGITAFLAIIFTALLLFAGIFADGARIAVAERKVQASLNTAVRSALAGCDEDLVGDYGLYGLDTGSESSGAKRDVVNYLKTNLAERHQGIRFITYEVDEKSVTAEGMGSLLNKEIYKRQILEYMKYRAPVTITENVVNKFLAAKIDKKLDFSEKENIARSAGQQIKGSLSRLKGNVKKIAVSVGKTAVREFKSTLTARITEDSAGYAVEQLKELLGICREAKEDVKTVNNGMSEYDRAKAEADEAADKAGASRTVSEFDAVNQAGKALEGVLDNNIAALENAVGVLTQKANQVKALKKDLEGLAEGSASAREKQAQIEALLSDMKAIVEGLKLEEPPELAEPSAEAPGTPRAESEGEAEDKKGFFESLKEELSKKLLLTPLDKSWFIPAEKFDAASQEDALKFEAMNKSVESVGRLSDEAVAEEQNQNILTFIKSVMDFLRNALTGSRDNLYITEYIMDKYTFVTSHTERDHVFGKGEVEYILWGKDVEAVNAGLVLGQVWFLRFGVDTLDYFSTSKVPHPVARLVEALIRGAASAFSDVFELYTGKGCYLSPSLKAVRLSYSDHLRVFLLMQPEDTKLARMRQLVQINIAHREQSSKEAFLLEDCSTLLKAGAEVKINLWILPLFQVDKFGIDRFKDGKYSIKKQTLIGY